MLPKLFLGVNPTELSLFLWFLITNITFQGTYSVTTPYQAWLAELFKNEDRPKVSAYQNVFNFIGGAVVALFSLIVITNAKDQMETNPNIVPLNLIIGTFIFGILVFVLFYINAMLMPVESTPKYKTNLINDLKKILKNKNFLIITLMQGIASLAVSLINSQLLGYTQIVLNFGTMQYLIVAVSFVLTLIIGVLLWVKSIRARGKKPTILTIFLIGIFVLPFSLIGFMQSSSMFIFGLIFVLFVGVYIAGWNIFPYLMYTDIAEDDQKKDGELKAGIYSGFPSIVLNVFQAFGFLMSGALLDLPNISMLSGPHSIGYIIWGPIAAIILIISFLYTWRFVQLDFSWEKRNVK